MKRESDIAQLLVSEGHRLARKRPKVVIFSKNSAADALINDLRRTPHAFVFGCVVDRQIKAERAWLIPLRMAELAGGSEFAKMKRLSVAGLKSLLNGPPSLHRFPEIMARLLRLAIDHIDSRYGGDASRIWDDCPSSAELVYRFLEFEGIGPKIATMAANILAQQFNVAVADHYSIDISADVHVKRVFTRLGLVPRHATVEQVIYRARGLHPKFPGLLDRPALHIGREWCKPRSPLCDKCFMSKVCPKMKA